MHSHLILKCPICVTRQYKGELTYRPLTREFPASQHWGIDLSSCTYGSRTIINTPIAGIVTPGSRSVFALYACRDTYLFSCPTEILIPNDVFKVYIDAIPGAKRDDTRKGATGLTEIPYTSINDMQPLHFTFGDREFTLDVDAQLLPERMNPDAHAGRYYSVVCPIDSEHVAGRGVVDFVLGAPFIQKYYTVSSGSCFEKSMLNGHPWQVYDAERQQIGFAEAYVLVWWDFCHLNLSITGNCKAYTTRIPCIINIPFLDDATPLPETYIRVA